MKRAVEKGGHDPVLFTALALIGVEVQYSAYA